MPIGLCALILFCVIAVHSELLQNQTQHKRGCGVTVICTSAPPACFGEYGEITISPSGGSGQYEYAVDQQTNWNPSNIQSANQGPHTCYAQDRVDLCIGSGSTVMPTGPDVLTGGLVTQTNLQCYNSGNTGSFTLYANGGTPGYSYSIDAGGSWHGDTFTNLAPGPYFPFVKDSHECQANLVKVVISQPADITGSIVGFTNLLCPDSGDTGTITLSGSGGTGTLSYSIDGQTWATNVFTGLAPKTYDTFFIKDSSSCTFQIPGSVTITRPSDLTGGVLSQTDLQCYNSGNTGSFTLTANGGTPGYSYSIDGGGTWHGDTFSDLAPGPYTPVVKDSVGCQTTLDTVTISKPADITGSIAGSTNLLCADSGDTGTITLSGSGGTGTLSYSIDGQTWGTNVFTGLAPKTYDTFFIQDSSLCTFQIAASVTITQPSAITGSIAGSTNLPCSDSGDIGTITLTGSGGTGDLSYSIDGQNWGTNVFSDLAPMTYDTFFIQDSSLCTFQIPASVNITRPSAIALTYNPVSAQCFGTFDPQISGGTAPYTFTLNGSVVTGSKPNGHYVWTVHDSAGCLQSGFVDLENNNDTGSPTITTTSKVPTKGGNLTLSGFFPQPLNASFDSVLVSCISPTNSTLICPVSSGSGGNHTVIVTTGLGGCLKSINATWSYMNPQVTSTSGINSHGGGITIQGNNFGTVTVLPTVTIGKRAQCTGCRLQGQGASAIVCTTCPNSGSMNDTLVVTIDGLSSAPFGFNYTGQDVCSNNGGCDYHVDCTDLGNGNRDCGACPDGTIGTGYTQCNTTCGDGKCIAQSGEDCLLCPQDCSQGGCGLCGDRVCDSPLEDCSSCFKDCGPCDSKKTCDGGCGGHGQCILGSGLCNCILPWTGPTCSSQSQVVNVTTNSSNPIVAIAPISGSPGENAKFSISIKSISEFTNAHVLVYSISLSEIEFSLAKEQNGQNTKFNYSASLKNGAFISVILWQLGQDTSLEFANSNTTYPADTIKIYVDISAWPFRALRNSLEVVLDSSSSSSGQSTKNCINSQEDESSSLQWLLVVVDDMSLYGQFENHAVIDGRVRTISYSLNQSDHSISVILPHFWDSANLDPSFNVLLGDSKATCGTHSKTNIKLILEIVLPIVAFLILALVIFLVFAPRIKLCFQLWKMERVPTKENGLEIEKINNMEVNSASGRYIVSL